MKLSCERKSRVRSVSKISLHASPPSLRRCPKTLFWSSRQGEFSWASLAAACPSIKGIPRTSLSFDLAPSVEASEGKSLQHRPDASTCPSAPLSSVSPFSASHATTICASRRRTSSLSLYPPLWGAATPIAPHDDETTGGWRSMTLQWTARPSCCCCPGKDTPLAGECENRCSVNDKTPHAHIMSGTVLMIRAINRLTALCPLSLSLVSFAPLDCASSASFARTHPCASVSFFLVGAEHSFEDSALLSRCSASNTPSSVVSLEICWRAAASS